MTDIPKEQFFLYLQNDKGGQKGHCIDVWHARRDKSALIIQKKIRMFIQIRIFRRWIFKRQRKSEEMKDNFRKLPIEILLHIMSFFGVGSETMSSFLVFLMVARIVVHKREFPRNCWGPHFPNPLFEHIACQLKKVDKKHLWTTMDKLYVKSRNYVTGVIIYHPYPIKYFLHNYIEYMLYRRLDKQIFVEFLPTRVCENSKFMKFILEEHPDITDCLLDKGPIGYNQDGDFIRYCFDNYPTKRITLLETFRHGLKDNISLLLTFYERYPDIKSELDEAINHFIYHSKFDDYGEVDDFKWFSKYHQILCHPDILGKECLKHLITRARQLSNQLYSEHYWKDSYGY